MRDIAEEAVNGEKLIQSQRDEQSEGERAEADRAKVAKWFQQYGTQVYGYLVYFTGSRDVEDCLQDTFVRALQSVHHYDASDNPLPWLITIARHIAIDGMRKQKHRTQSIYQQEIPSQDRTPDQLAEQNDTLVHVLNLVQNISSKYRDVLILRGIQDMSPQDVATVLGCSVGNVNVIYHRALKLAQKLIREQEGGKQGDR